MVVWYRANDESSIDGGLRQSRAKVEVHKYFLDWRAGLKYRLRLALVKLELGFIWTRGNPVAGEHHNL